MPKMSDERVNQRRREMCAMIFRGFDKTDVYDHLVEKYEVTRPTVQSDWSRRDQWMPKIFDIDNAEQIVVDILAENKEIKRELWKLKEETDNDTVKLGAMREIQDVNEERLEMMQSIGLIEKAADTIKIESAQTEDEDSNKISAKDKIANMIESFAHSQKSEDDEDEVIDVTPEEGDEDE